MKPEEVQKHLDELRKWVNHFYPASVLTVSQKPVVKGWHQEFAAIATLLEQKAEIPIAFLGPAQQGKSSLINAILGENILAVGGAVGACTCVITSVQHQNSPAYRAEIDFIPLKDWKAELRAMQTAMNAKPSKEDTEEDRREWETEQKAAHEKFTSVYRQEPPADLAAFIDHENLSLPFDIASAMTDDKPIELVEANAITLRNKVRRYLVGRGQHADGQFWPLIRRVRIFGNFPALANGVVLVDLPGLNDPNPAREQVTKKYLAKAKYVWLVCDCQVGIDRVFFDVLRDHLLLFELYIQGRLDAFSVIATKFDNINLEIILEQMGLSPEEYQGDFSDVLDFRRKEIKKYVKNNLAEIARDIASRADTASVREEFFRRVNSIHVFPVSTAAYLHAIGKNNLFKGMQMTAELSHVPDLLNHLNTVTAEQSMRAQVEAARRRLKILREQIKGFFLDRIRNVELDNETARQESAMLYQVAAQAVAEGQNALRELQIRSEAALQERCGGFEQRLEESQKRAAQSLRSVFNAWESINWRSLQAAVRRDGVWFSRSLNREFDFNRDVARAYLDLLPFVWEEFFGVLLSKLITDVSQGTQAELQKTAKHIQGALDMIKHQPPGIRESMEASLRAAGEGFALQSGQVIAELNAQIQRTRQQLSAGMVQTAAKFMQAAYDEAAADPGGTGIKRRMLDKLTHYAAKHGPTLFINIRQELAEGVTVLQGSMMPQLSRLVTYGEGVLQRFSQNTGNIEPPTAEDKGRTEEALKTYPEFSL